MRLARHAPEPNRRERTGKPYVVKRGLLRGLLSGLVLTVLLAIAALWFVRLALQALGDPA